MIRILAEYQGSPVRVQRAAAPVFRRVFQRTGEVWFRTMLPKHFTSQAAREYRYERRTRPYMMRKAKKKHHQKGLTWSGRSEREAKRMARITATAKRATVKVSVPHYFTRSGQRKSYHMARELVAVSPADDAKLTRVFDTAATHELNMLNVRELKQLV